VEHLALLLQFRRRVIFSFKNPGTSPCDAVNAANLASSSTGALMVREILEVLEKCPLAQYALGKDLVRVLPATADGFEVVIEQIWENHYSVTYGRWHEDFYSLEEALGCFFLGLTNHCRLEVSSKHGNPFRWTAEYWDDPHWRKRSTKTTWSHRIFAPAVTAYMQNDLPLEIDVQPILNKLVALHCSSV
jgi:hypothetical protein